MLGWWFSKGQGQTNFLLEFDLLPNIRGFIMIPNLKIPKS